MFDSPPNLMRCIPTAATEQCGEEIGSHVGELEERLEATCGFEEKRERGIEEKRGKL